MDSKKLSKHFEATPAVIPVPKPDDDPQVVKPEKQVCHEHN